MNIIELIGKTPLVQLKNMDAGSCELYVKLENQNPGGSIKDRIALLMIETAEKEGRLKPGGTIVEGTAGNTGVALIQVANLKGYKTLLVIPDKMSKEKIDLVRAMGAEVIVTRSDVSKGHPEYYLDLAERLARERENAIYIGQFVNPANPLAHEQSTAPEIWEQMQHKVDAIVCGIGTGGHFTGISRYFKRVSPQTKIILADPENSVLASYMKTGKLPDKECKWMVEGIGRDYISDFTDVSFANQAYSVSDADAFKTARELLKKESIFGGSSSGLAVCAALRYCRAQKNPQRVVTFIYDSGNKYLSKMYNNEWMEKNGFKI